MTTVSTNIFTPRQCHVLLIVALVALGGLVLIGLASYVSAFLGAGVLCLALLSYLEVLPQVFAEENRQTQATAVSESLAA